MLIVLATNIFEFDGQLYLQKDGTAIGTKAAPCFANLFMSKWEKMLKEHWTGDLVKFWRRYIDDILFIWYGTKDELEALIGHENTLMPSIKVTCEFNFETRAVNFLDTTLFVDNDGYLRTDLYKKENLKNSYLLPSSAHPSHITQNAPFSHALRLKRICWSDTLFEKRVEELKADLISRGYSPRSLSDSINRARQIPRAQALEKVQKDREVAGRVRFVVKFDPSLPNIRDVLKRSWGVLTKDPIMKTCFPKPPMVCYKRVQNIRELLVKAKLPANQGRCSRRNQERPNGFKPCREPCL